MIADLSPIYVYFNLYTLLDEPNLTMFLKFIIYPCVTWFHLSLLNVLIDFRHLLQFKKSIPCFNPSLQNNLDPFHY